jgi:16S rRNA (guanine966-N2)-methyltransferase
MRIVGGKHRSRNLSTLQGDNTRPSSDRLKEALFNKIGPYFDGGSFLDMFGGSGAVGLEALSRGVSSVVFVESNRHAIKVIEDNIKRLNEGDMCTIIKKDALMFSKETSEVYDYIFMDAPYEYAYIQDVMNNMVKNMKKGSLLIVETRKNHQLEVPDRLELLSSKAYGMALLSIFEMLD